MNKTYIIFVLVLIALPGYAQNEKPIQIVFVCEHGAGRSVMASKYFERTCAEKGIKVKTVFRGISPDPEIGKSVNEGPSRDGFTLKDGKVKVPVHVHPT